MANYALDFDYYASLRPYVDLNLSPASGSFAFEIALKYGSVSTADNHKYIFGFDAFGQGSRLWIYHNKYGGIRAYVSDQGGANAVALIGSLRNEGDSVVYRIEYNKLGTFALYEDGVLVDSATLTFDYVSFGPMYLGATQALSGGTKGFDGEVDYVSYVDNVTSANSRIYDFDEGSGAALQYDAIYVNPPANDAQWVLLGGGAENYSGTALASALSDVPVVGSKSAAGLAQSLSSSAFGVFGSKFAQGVSALSDSTAVSPTGVKAGQGVIAASSDADALFLGEKAGAGTVIVSVVPGLNVSGLVHFFGSVGAQCVSALALQGAIGGAVIHKSGFAVSSSAPAVLVSGLKSAIGAVVCSNGNDVSLEAVKSAEGRCVLDQAEVVLLLGVAVKAGILVDATNAVLIATGANPDAEVHKSVYELSAVKRDYLYQGVANRVVQLEGRLAA